MMWSVLEFHVAQMEMLKLRVLGTFDDHQCHIHRVLLNCASTIMILPSRLRHLAVALLSLSTSLVSASSTTNSSVKVLADTFTPSQVFENENLVRNINLEKSYARETTNLVIKNVGREAQSEYYYLFPSEDVANVGGLEVKDKKNATAGAFQVELAQYENPK
jgi:hypothetical protein